MLTNEELVELFEESPEPWQAAALLAQENAAALQPYALKAAMALGGLPQRALGICEVNVHTKEARLVSLDAPDFLVKSWQSRLEDCLGQSVSLPSGQSAHSVGAVGSVSPSSPLWANELGHEPGWFKIAASPFLRRAGELLNFFPGEYLPGVPNAPSPVSAMLTSGLVGAGLGYGAGWLGEKVLPAHWRRKNLRRTGAVLGGVMGAAPGAWLSSLALSNGDNPFEDILTTPGLRHVPEGVEPINQSLFPEIATSISGNGGLAGKTAGTKAAVDDDYGMSDIPPVRVDEFNRVLWGDPNVRSNVPVMTSGLASAALQAAQGLPGGVGAGNVTAGQLARLAVGMGSGWLAGAVAGKALGVMMGMPPEDQQWVRRTGLFAGVVNAVVPALFGH